MRLEDRRDVLEHEIDPQLLRPLSGQAGALRIRLALRHRQPEDALGTAEGLGAVELLGGEVALRRDGRRLDHALAGAQQQHRGLGHDESGDDRQRRPPACAFHANSMA
jgi:hypothetical protein